VIGSDCGLDWDVTPPKDSMPPAAGSEEPQRPDPGGARLKATGMPSMASAWMRLDPGEDRRHRSPLVRRGVPADGIDDAEEVPHLPLSLVGEAARRQHPGEQAANPTQ
jgi:hypothetical protein